VAAGPPATAATLLRHGQALFELRRWVEAAVVLRRAAAAASPGHDVEQRARARALENLGVPSRGARALATPTAAPPAQSRGSTSRLRSVLAMVY
jgi:hypothetical protein